MFPVGNVESEPGSAFNKGVNLFPSGKFHVQFVSRDHHGRNGDRAIIFPTACQITGSTSSAAPRKTSVVTSVLLKNIASEPLDISMDWRNASSAAWTGGMHPPPCRRSRSRAPAAPRDSAAS